LAGAISLQVCRPSSSLACVCAVARASSLLSRIPQQTATERALVTKELDDAHDNHESAFTVPIQLLFQQSVDKRKERFHRARITPLIPSTNS
jgi:hypothetical protein